MNEDETTIVKDIFILNMDVVVTFPSLNSIITLHITVPHYDSYFGRFMLLELFDHIMIGSLKM